MNKLKKAVDDLKFWVDAAAESGPNDFNQAHIEAAEKEIREIVAGYEKLLQNVLKLDVNLTSDLSHSEAVQFIKTQAAIRKLLKQNSEDVKEETL